MEQNNIIKELQENRNTQQIVANVMRTSANFVDAVQRLIEHSKVTDFTRNEIRNDIQALTLFINAAILEVFENDDM